jgi:hypothetical protein
MRATGTPAGAPDHDRPHARRTGTKTVNSAPTPFCTDERIGYIATLASDGAIGGTEGSTGVDCPDGEPQIARQGDDRLDEG